MALVAALEDLARPAPSEVEAEADDPGGGLWAQTGAESVIAFLMEWAETLADRDVAPVPILLPQFRALMERAADALDGLADEEVRNQKATRIQSSQRRKVAAQRVEVLRKARLESMPSS